MASDSDDDEIFRFSAPKLGPTPSKRPRPDDCASNNSSFIIESDSDEDRHFNRRGKGGSKAASLLRNLKKGSSSSGEDGSPWKSKNAKAYYRPQGSDIDNVIVNVTDSEDEGMRSRSPSPPPAAHATSSSLVKQSSALIASLRQSRREQDTPLMPCDLTEDTPQSCSEARPMTLRVRIGKKTHRITVQVTEPFLDIVERLAALLHVGSSHILLTHKTQTIQPHDTPSLLGIDTTDFIDGVVMEESISAAPNTLEGDGGEVLVKVQSQKDSEMYRIAKDDPLGKVMDLFAAKVAVPVDRIKFSFDGDPVNAKQTANDLGLEDEDALDARVT